MVFVSCQAQAGGIRLADALWNPSRWNSPEPALLRFAEPSETMLGSGGRLRSV